MYSYNPYYANYLAHFGIKRKSGRYPYGSGDRPHQHDGKRKIDVDEDVTIKKGTKVYRISAEQNDIGGLKYINYKQRDRDIYKMFWPDELRGDNKDKEIYENTYKITQDLKSPSAEKRLEIAQKISNDDEVLSIMANRNVAGRIKLKDKNGNVLPDTLENRKNQFEELNKALNGIYGPELQSIMKKLVDQKIDSYKNERKEDPTALAQKLITNIGSNEEIKQKFISETKKAGYNCMIDDYGKDMPTKHMKMDSPVIVFDSEEVFKPYKSKKVSQISQSMAANRVINRNYSESINPKKYYINSTPGAITDYGSSYTKDMKEEYYGRHVADLVKKYGSVKANNIY